MPSKSSATKSYGLRLVLPGAPENTLHHIVIDNQPGLYGTGEPTPVGGPGEPSVEAAREAAKGDDAPVKLEEIGPRKVETLREEQPETITDVADAGQEEG